MKLDDHWLRSMRGLPMEVPGVVRFLRRAAGDTSFAERALMLSRFYRISARVPCAHKQSEVLPVIAAILNVGPAPAGCIVEAGAFRGASTAKLSLACAHVRRRLVVFDSFRGLPENDEVMQASDVFGVDRPGRGRFEAGEYRGTREQVEATLRRYGAREVCELVEGWFEHTLPDLDEPVCVAFLDVDLASSTKTCLDGLHPHMVEGGLVFSHDGHLPHVREVFASDHRWVCEGLGDRRLVVLRRR